MNPVKASEKMQQHVFSLAPLGVWIRLIIENGGVPRRYWTKLAKVLSISFMTAPFRLTERLAYSPSRVSRISIDEPPIYIQGFGRSGTTHLLNILAQDPSFGFISTFQAVAAPMFLVGRGWLERMVGRGIRGTRPMDNMTVSLDLPQEEEIAVANTSHLSFVHHLSFPRRANYFLKKFATMQLTEAELAQWEATYLNVLRKASLVSGGQRLVLKSPTNLGRTSNLLWLFPDAKFIHIVRNPYEVFLSMKHLYQTMLPICQLDDADSEEVVETIVASYSAMMQKYLIDREMIPQGNLAEIRFEKLESSPMEEIERLYSELSLPGWEQAREPISNYLETLSGYRKNTYRFDQDSVDVVSREWRFALEEWGYQPPDVSQD